MLTLRQMRYFDALATTRHFGRAAEMVHISQPALSTQIMEMEEYLGAKLVERTRQNTILTPKGEEVLHYARAILHQVDLLEQTARKGGGTLEGLIRIGIIPTVAPYLVPQFVPHLRKTYPSVEVELREAVTDRLMADLLTGKLDAVIAALPLDIEGIQTRPLFTDRFFMAVADNGEAVLMSPLTEHEVNVDRLLLLEEGHCLRDQALAVCSAGKRSLVNFGATSMATLLQMVSHDMGMTLIPEMAIPTETSRNSIRIVPFADPQPSREIGLAWRRSNHRGKEMEALAEAIIAVAPAPHELAA
ncbi:MULTISPECIES: hydrogen peroxide-inducible genes activator [unclassified Rhizobium]|uniref:hydrogen peroxide-inducible genes activator n=1 Tax=unclassified Rhizobium TaxID=2613769 RepID=UPI000271A977|nr:MULTISPECIES: hydrogen peroxide-inducible genes activator [unclassified Rhizobium]EJL51616.1 transcriptional regulator [Rhizobium sp. CF122]MBB3394028.1 LysR family hydrogen peroxide-inducible transcriptional activator [Rhizobium sp. BK060]MBB4168228.1 LysR family hydrogen peroxide-inducible transcriptional activator [Rhizobium sp. BK538]MBZ9789296.1 LysR family transcriptional regulator [Rhizobium sp. 3T7]TCM80711.1 LysR family hydrogen peroxide-inducible transcriptional activator [Rhizobi